MFQLDGVDEFMAKSRQKAAQYFLKGTQAMKVENFGIAKTMFTKALEQDKDNPDIMVRLSQVLLATGHAAQASVVLKRCVKRKPNNPDALLLLSQAQLGLNEVEEMRRTLDKALGWDPTHGPSIHAQVVGYINSGQIDAAQEVLDRVGDDSKSHVLVPMSRVKVLRAQKSFAKGIDLANEIVARDGISDRHKRSVRFELGHLYDAVGEYENAFRMFQLGNAGHIQGKTLHAESMIAMWTPEMLANIPLANVSDERPVFIAGMPRSGTTLTERILDAHPSVAGIGECPLIAHQLGRMTATSLGGSQIDAYAQEYIDMLDERVGSIAESGITRVIDKHMGAERTLGIISRMFPNAKVIHCLRDPIDSCLSSYFQNFGTNVSYSRDLSSLGKMYVAHRKMMDHWYDVLDLEILPSSYEALVADPEPQSRKLVAHVGLEFDERCLRFHESDGHVSTASSVQVRSPMYQSSKQRWRNYEPFIGELIEHLGEYADTESTSPSTTSQEHGA